MVPPKESKPQCEMADSNPPSDTIKEILSDSKRIAIVGLSDKPERDSNRVARYLIDHGYEVIPVNPTKEEILGRRSYPSLKDIPGDIDVVDIFRRPEAIPEIVDDAIEIGARVIWMQIGLANREAAEKARKKGLKVVQSKCIKQEHERIWGNPA